MAKTRTTLLLSATLLKEAKQMAVRKNLTLSELVDNAIRDALHLVPKSAAPFTMVTYGSDDGSNNDLVDHEPADFYEAIENDDAEFRKMIPNDVDA